MADINSTVANNLQAIRKERQMTLQELADLTGVSKTMLGEIEHGASSPTITVLWKITSGLKIPISTLIYEKMPIYKLARREDWRVLEQKPGCRFELIFEYDDVRNFEVYHLEFLPHSASYSEPHQKGVVEYTMVYEGVMVITVGDQDYVLGEADSFIFEGNISHSYHNKGDTMVKAYSLIYYPPSNKPPSVGDPQ